MLWLLVRKSAVNIVVDFIQGEEAVAIQVRLARFEVLHKRARENRADALPFHMPSLKGILKSV